MAAPKASAVLPLLGAALEARRAAGVPNTVLAVAPANPNTVLVVVRPVAPVNPNMVLVVRPVAPANPNTVLEDLPLNLRSPSTALVVVRPATLVNQSTDLVPAVLVQVPNRPPVQAGVAVVPQPNSKRQQSNKASALIRALKRPPLHRRVRTPHPAARP